MDHCQNVKRKEDLRDRANIFSTLTFFYTRNVFVRAYRKTFTEKNLYDAPKSLKSKQCGNPLDNRITKAKKAKKAISAFSILWRQFGKYYLFLGVIDLSFHVFYNYYQPETVSKLIGYFSKNSKLTKNDAYYYGGFLLLIQVFRVFFYHNYTLVVFKFAQKVRTSYTSLLYRKIMRLSCAALNEITLGNIVTIVTKDVASFEDNIFLINDMILGNLEITYTSCLLYYKMGPTSLLGIGIMIFVLPLQAFLAKLVANWRLEMNKKTDERLQVMQESLSAIKIIKMYTWEECFVKKIVKARLKELGLLIQIFFIQVIVLLIGLLTSRVSFFASILLYIYYHSTATAEFVYYVLACFTNIRGLLALSIPYGWTYGAQMFAALCRINTVLNAEEVNDEDEKVIDLCGIAINDVTVDMKGVTLLKDISVRAETGLYVVNGPVGSGKSVFIKTLLKEFSVNSGNINIKGSVSYASQEPWLFPSTIKQNITFGETYNKLRYSEVIKVCALEYDFKIMDNGENTIVADKGMNLSKGQQARISLARAIYKESDIYLLDDPLAALDGNIQDYIFHACIEGFLKDKLCILVTQNDKQAQRAKKIWTIKEKTLLQDDIYSEYINNKTNGEITTIKDEASITNMLENLEKKDIEVYNETHNENPVDFNYYIKYFKLGGGFLLLNCILMICVLNQIVSSYSDTLLSNWVDLNQKAADHSNDTNSTIYEETKQETSQTIYIYLGMIVASIVLELVLAYTHLAFLKKSAIKIHNLMATSVIKAAMSFFDVTFIGNILNRFSQDLSVVDESLPFILLYFPKGVFEICAVTIVLSNINWKFLPVAVGFIIVAVILRYFYLPVGRSLKRMESTTRSPLIGHLNCTLEGLITIRAYKKQEALIKEFDRHHDLYTSSHFLNLVTSKAFCFLVDATCILLITFIVVRFLFFDTDISAGSVGLALTQVMVLSETVQWSTKNWANLETLMTNLERVLEYTEIKQESKKGKTLENWPKKGSVKFNAVSLRYSKNENILRDLTFTVKARQKIGIIGRTGAGKSSIISTLFRLYEIQGNIFIDEVDIKCLSLDFLRKSLAIIPQDPVLFNGTMRFNIDPTNSFSDKDVWRVLELVKLKDSVVSLDSEIHKNSSFSTGQKQLICLARAIIRKSKIILLDEASANMDLETEKLLQDVIESNFHNQTLFVIAHRLSSIISCDKILVLNNGQLIEFDSPKVLLKNKNGYFYKIMNSLRK
ncbi:unnamed protein product [Brassicogethes aeneus]|uniref:Multidrug resistance-associated protein lethal(2)03659 n=1 Tax=Brassicogethes aeneus TaxID=1431903 RepID=A0A9P0B821_BRAAE|nr:unnamed protein product [Brassicogethes aeneus]